MSGALFGSSAAGSRSTSKNLVEFRAGKMELKGTTVTPDKRKGLLYLYQSDDSLMHFCWKDRTTGTVVDDLIIFPDDCEFKRVQQCTTGRVYILKFKLSARKFFFWMQEPKTDKDDEHCKKVNEMLNNPPAPGSTGLGGGGRGSGGGLPADLAGLGAGLGEGSLQSMLGNMDQQQMMQLLSGGALGGLGSLGMPGLLGAARPGGGQSSGDTPVRPSRVQSSPAPRPTTTSSTSTTPTARTTPASTATTSQTTPTTQTATARAVTAPSTTPASQVIQLSDLQSILSSMNIPGEGQAAQPALDMSQLITSDAMTPILASPEIQEKLIPFLPEGESLPKDPEQLRATFQSPQFQQALGMFTAAFQSGQLGPLMGQFGLSQEALDAANKGDLEAFGKALQTGSGGTASSTSKPDSKGGDKKDEGKDGGKKDGDDEAMSLD